MASSSSSNTNDSAAPADAASQQQQLQQQQQQQQDQQQQQPQEQYLGDVPAVEGMEQMDSEDEDEEDPLFQQAPSLSGAHGLQVVARSMPGAFFQKGVEEITRFLGEREGASGENADLSARALAYLNCIFHGKHPVSEVGPRTSKEMRTLALAIDGLAQG